LINSTPSATDRNKVTGLVRIDPQRNVVRQSSALGNPHGGGRGGRDAALRRPDAAARRPYH